MDQDEKWWGKDKRNSICGILKMDKNLLQMFFPAGLLEYFTVIKWEEESEAYIFHLEEKNIAPRGYKKIDIESKGFCAEEKVKDFPVRGKECIYRIRRRKWIEKSTGKMILRDWNLLAKGTRMTEEFATFLKAFNRYNAHKL